MPDQAVHTSPPARSGAATWLVLGALALVTGTFLRIGLVFLYPFVALFIAYYFRFRLTHSLLLMLSLAALSFLLSLYPHLFLRYKFLSLSYMLPFLLLLFGSPAPDPGKPHLLSRFMRCLTVVAVVNNLIGIVQVILHPETDDSFLGIYTQYSVSVNGLMLLNTVLFFYYFTQLRGMAFWPLAMAGFFLGCAILGYYGAGMAVGAAAFLLGHFRARLGLILKTLVLGSLSLAAVIYLMLLIRPRVVYYNLENIRKLTTLDPVKAPRKILSFRNYLLSYPDNPKDLLFGSGPGTFNSRSAFMVGSPSYFSAIPWIKDEEQPWYFKHYAYSLWNASNTIKELYLDGFRNQPFSSLLAFLGEYGLIFTVLFTALYIGLYRQISALYQRRRGRPEAASLFRFFKILIFLLPLLLLIDNYYEYPEIMLILLPALGFARAALSGMPENQTGHET